MTPIEIWRGLGEGEERVGVVVEGDEVLRLGPRAFLHCRVTEEEGRIGRVFSQEAIAKKIEPDLEISPENPELKVRSRRPLGDKYVARWVSEGRER